MQVIVPIISTQAHARQTIILVILILSGSALLLPVASAFEDSRTLSSGDYHGYDITGISDSSKYLDFEVDVQGSIEFDIYILNGTEYSNYANGYDFESFREYEKTLDRNFSWGQDGSGDHYLVIDNKDNAHRNDARPAGEMSYVMRYHLKDYKDGSSDLLIMYLFLMACFIFVFIIIIVVLVKGTGFLVRLVRGRGDQPDPAVHPPPAQVGEGRWGGPPSSPASQTRPYDPGTQPPASYDPHDPHDHQGHHDHHGNDAHPPSSTPSYRPSPASSSPISKSSVQDRYQDQSSQRAYVSQGANWPGSAVEPGYEAPKGRTSSASPGLCPGCGDPIKPRWKICPGCSRSLRMEPSPPTKVCHECGQTLGSEWKVCPKCTSPVEAPGPTLCPGCESEVEADWKACPICASPLDQRV